MKRLTDVAYWEEDVWKNQRPRQLRLYRDYDLELVRRLRGLVPGPNARVLEVGAGGSRVLPYLAKHVRLRATGIDYSASGCRLLSQNFRILGIKGDVVREDFLQPSIRPGQFDLVYSLGLIEHFDDLPFVLQAHANFLKPGGTLFVASPNLQGVYGNALRRLAPALLARHRVFGPEELGQALRSVGLEAVFTGYLGTFYFRIGADSDWVFLQNWPAAVRSLLRGAVKLANASVSLAFRLSPWHPHSRALSTGFYAAGRKPL